MIECNGGFSPGLVGKVGIKEEVPAFYSFSLFCCTLVCLECGALEMQREWNILKNNKKIFTISMLVGEYRMNFLRHWVKIS